MRIENVGRRTAVASIVTALGTGVAGVAALRAGEKSKTLIYAAYSGQDIADDVSKSMKSAQSSTGERIESYAVVAKFLKGKVRIRDQRRRDTGVGAVIQANARGGDRQPDRELVAEAGKAAPSGLRGRAPQRQEDP